MTTAEASVWVAGIAAVASIITAVLSLHNRRALNTGNGHTAGQGIAKIEDRMESHENRLDRIEVRIVENMSEIREAMHDAQGERQRMRFDLERHQQTYEHQRKSLE